VYAPYEWKACSATKSSITPSVLRALFTNRCEYIGFHQASVWCFYLSLAHGPISMGRVKDCTSTNPAFSSLSLSSSSLEGARPDAIIASLRRRLYRTRGLSAFKEPSSHRAYAKSGSDDFRKAGRTGMCVFRTYGETPRARCSHQVSHSGTPP
jgi:hypothetical protein